MAEHAKAQIRISAKNLDQALAEAAEQLRVGVDDIDYRILSQKSGFLFMGKKVEILAYKSARARSESQFRDDLYGKDEPKDLPELSPAELNELQSELMEFCKGISAFFSTEEQISVDSEQKDGRLLFNINNLELEAQLTKNPKLAESLEHILRKKPRHLKRELPFRIFVDAGGVRQKREEELAAMARDLSEKVYQNKKPIVLNYKSSYDRKIIHMALDQDNRVYTRSIGSGVNRKLMILPVKPGTKAQAEDLEY